MTETIKEDDSTKSLLILVICLGVLGIIVVAVLYLSGFFEIGGGEKGVDYELLAYIPDEGLKGVTYVWVNEDFFQEISSLVGEMLGGRFIKDIRNSEMAAVSYEDGSSAYIVYLETGQDIEELIQGVRDLGGGYMSLGMSISVEKKVMDGKVYRIIHTGDSYSQPLCAWEHDKGVIILGFQSSYSGRSDTERKDCTSIIGKRYTVDKFREFLAGAEALGNKIKPARRMYAEGWMHSVGYGSNESMYGLAYGDEGGDYLLIAKDQALGHRADSNFCIGGRTVKRDGKEACLKEQSSGGLLFIPLTSLMTLERGVGDHLIYVAAYPKEINKENVEEKALDLIYSIELEGDEQRWLSNKTLTITVKDYKSKEAVYNARVRVYGGYSYSGGREVLREGYTGDNGVVEFSDMPLESASLVVTKEGYDNGTGYISQTGTEETIHIKKNYCGDYKCGKNENCLTCPGDCKCGYDEECVDGECKREVYSIDLPDVKKKTWNISYIPKSNKIKISSKKCFYLDIFYSSGEEIDPYDADVKTCRSSTGKVYNATGTNSASWFNWGGCASTKYYEVEKGSDIILKVHTDSCSSCVCYHPDFNIHEEIDGRWVKYKDGGASIIR